MYAWLAASLALDGEAEEASRAAACFHQAFDQRCTECGVEEPQDVRSFLTARFPFKLERDATHFLTGLEQAGVELQGS